MSEHAIDRRTLLALAAAAATAGASTAGAAEQTMEEHMRMMNTIPADAPKVAMLVYPQMVSMDLVGPLTVFTVARFDTRLVWKDKNPVPSVERVPFAANQTFAECPADLDVLFVPGGIIGTTACMKDPEVLGFLADRGSRAKWVTSVCTGGLVLAAAGLLNGYDATALWAVADLLPIMGARHVDKRVVTDRNRMTGGGVTAGIDFALTLVAAMRGEELARQVELTIEYAPEPPFRSGSPAEAGPERTAAMRESRKVMDDQARLAAIQAAKRLGI